MLKLDSLRDFLTQSVPALGVESDRLKIFIEKGSVRGTGAATEAGIVGFEYVYTCTLLLLDLAEDADLIFLALLVWIGRNQPDLLQNVERNRQGVPFEADILSLNKIDLQISLELTERVIATPRPGGGFTIIHAPEPEQAGLNSWPAGTVPPAPATHIFVGDQLVAEIPAG